MQEQAAQPDTELRSGFVAIVGRPNVGKSTLLNHLIGEKLSIVSSKAQTTRHRITGILTQSNAQYVFVDTPGFQIRYNNALNSAMNRGVISALNEVDVVVFVVEAGRFDKPDDIVMQLLQTKCPVILAVNKTDRIKQKKELLDFLAFMGEKRDFADIVPISALKGRQLDDLLVQIKKHLPNKTFLFEPDEITDRSERFLAAEYIREKVFRLVGDELPYSVSVEIEKFEQTAHMRRIFASIIVDRASHKAMIIGKQGQKLKRIASEARQDMEKLFDGKVYLEVWVKVKNSWQNDERLLKELGYI